MSHTPQRTSRAGYGTSYSGSGISGGQQKLTPTPIRRSRSYAPEQRDRRQPHSTIRHGTGYGTPQKKHEKQFEQVHAHIMSLPTNSSQDDAKSVSSAPLSGAVMKETRQQPSFRLNGSTPALSKSGSKSGSIESSKMGSTQLRGEKIVAIRKAIDDISKHLNDDKRKSKLMQACVEFDHWDDARHNAELEYGAANVLALALTITKDDDELRIICSALEMVCRAANSNVYAAFQKIGASSCPWLLKVLKRAEAGNMIHPNVSMMNITKLFCYWSRMSQARLSLARFPGIMEMLIRTPTVSYPEAKTARMKLLSNLASSEENKIFFMETDGLLDAVLRTAVFDSSEKAKEYASTTLMDLAACPDNQVKMASDGRLLGTMVKLAVTEAVHETREAAISGLQNLAYCQSNRIPLVTFSNGVVLDALRKTLSTDVNDKARRRAAGALTNMACDETAEYMGNHKGLLEALAVISTKDENEDVQARAAMALTKLASSINTEMDCYKTLMDALVVASLSHTRNSVSHVFRVKARDPESRYYMARHPGVLDTLSDICISSHHSIEDRENAMRALMHLTNEDINRKIMCKKSVLDALILGAHTDEEKWQGFSESAVIALERLATDHTNRPIMARHPGLLVAVAYVTEKEQALEDNRVEAKHERLAKPLLMSLLLAL